MSYFERAGPNARPGYLIEVQGLRTAAAVLVAIYHIWLNRVSGGVDVFFVVAGFFLVAAFERRAPTGVAYLRDYYATTLRRVLPVAVLVMLATIGVWMFVLPDVLWDGLAPHAVYTAAFVENLHLAAISTNYLQPSLASPFQQFWALSLQMQVYVGLPVLLLLASLAGRLLRIPLQAMLTVALGLLFAGSLAYSVMRTAESQPQAYFETGTRLWEFAAGGLLALWSRAISLPKWAASVLGWLGLAGLLLMGLVVDVSRSFPGIVALLPVGFAAAIIICAQNGGVVHALRNRYVVAFGDYSFAFYLWHWPLLIATRYLVDSPRLSVIEGVAILVLAAALAIVTTRLAETPIRRSHWLSARPWASVIVGVVLALVPLAAGLGWYATDRARLAEARSEVADYVAAPRALGAGEFVPALVLAPRDTPRTCRVRGGSGSKPVQCEFGDRKATRIIAVVGASHIDQYLPAFDAYGKREGYKIIAMTKGGVISRRVSAIALAGHGTRRRSSKSSRCVRRWW